MAGEFFHFHLSSDKGDKVSMWVFVPLEHPDEPVTLEGVEKGHTKPGGFYG